MSTINQASHKTSLQIWSFWTLLFFFSILGCYFAYVHIPQLYAMLHISITEDKHQIEKIAQLISKKYNLGPQAYAQVSNFITDKNMEHYIQHNLVQANLQNHLKNYIQRNLYQTYTWQVRHFKEGNTRECLLKFSPQGKPYGFIEHIPETDAGPALKEEEALAIAKKCMVDWDINPEMYHLSESSYQARAHGRVDYTFIFEERAHLPIKESLLNAQLNNNISTLIWAVSYKLIICVCGNKVTVLDHIVEVPEIVYQDHQPISITHISTLHNNTDSLYMIFIYLFYVLICFVGLIILIKNNYLIKNNAFVLGLLIACVQLALQLSALPEVWLNYNIAQSSGAYFINNVLGYLIGVLFYAILYSVITMIAEGLTRASFPQHIQWWKSFNKQVTSSRCFIEIVLSSYLLAGIYIAYTVAFFVYVPKFSLLTIQLLPLHATILGHYFPAISILAESITESFWQETIFRAIPIACFTLIGQKLGIRKIGLSIGFIIHLIIIGMVPSGPLFLSLSSSFFLGLLYINFGLLSSFLVSFIYHTAFFALPLYTATAYSMSIQKGIIIMGLCLPIIVLLINFIRIGKISALSATYLNKEWAPVKNLYKEEETVIPTFNFSIGKTLILSSLTFISALVIYQNINLNNSNPPFNITRDQAIEKAKKYILGKGLLLDADWEILSRIILPNKSAIKFIWQNFGKEVYDKLNGTYIKQPIFEIKFAKFEGSLSQRTNEYTLLIDHLGKIESFQHILPEEAPGRILSEKIAHHLAIAVTAEQFKLDPSTLKIISSVEIKRPERKDWIITINDTTVDYIGKGRAYIIVKICGDAITSIKRKIHTPQEWLSHKSKLDQFSIIFELLKEFILLIFIVIGFFQLLQTQKARASILKAVMLWLCYVCLIITSIVLSMPEITAYLNTAKSFYFQIIYAEVVTITKAIVKSLGILILAMNVFNNKNLGQTNLRSLSLSTLCLGIIAIGLATICSLYSGIPQSYSLEPLNTYEPITYFVISKSILFISEVLTILFIAQYAQFKFSLKTIFSTYAITLLIISNVEIIDLSSHILLAAILFLIILISYLSIIRYNTLLILPIILMLQLSELAQEYIAHPFFNSQQIILITVFVITLITLLIIMLMNTLGNKN